MEADTTPSGKPALVKLADFFPYDGKDPRNCYDIVAMQCQRCKIVFGDLGTGTCPACNHHFIKPV